MAETRSKPRRRSFRFSLRAFLLAVLVVGGGLGWQLHVVHRRVAMRDWLRFRDAEILTEGELNDFANYQPDIAGWGKIPWYRHLLGDRAVLIITLRADVPNESVAQVERAFPEAFVTRRADGPAMNDQQYAAVKQRADAEELYQAKLDRLFTLRAQLSLDELLVFAPALADRLAEETRVAVDSDIVSTVMAIDCLRTIAALREQVGRSNKSSHAQSDVRLQLAADVKRLRSSLASPSRAARNPASMDFDARLLDYELACCVAAAPANIDTATERQASDARIAQGDLLCDAAARAFDEGTIPLVSLVGAWERRRDARLAAADLASDPDARRAAWKQFAESAERRLAIAEPLFRDKQAGGEPESYYLLRCCIAGSAAALARHDADGRAELAAVRSEAADAQQLIEASRADSGGKRVAVEQYVDAIHRRAAVEQRLAQLSPNERAAAERGRPAKRLPNSTPI